MLQHRRTNGYPLFALVESEIRRKSFEVSLVCIATQKLTTRFTRLIVRSINQPAQLIDSLPRYDFKMQCKCLGQ
ncbi:hypothetical protein AOQ72_34165 [Bradyrhizobium yuanmingense]|uniref:Uncharacterized protein n=1 Tax=Bradyrhizobium yuanmingense TaxID=108015 RepID=A0A0R3C906_9BRAD|nr:hypothetical protein AOQ72_34165 [Bradyrhizobium yuanmingense]